MNTVAEPAAPVSVHHAGELAYLDTTFATLVPCKVLAVDAAGICTVRLTATRGAYKRGETVTESSNHTLPRSHIVRRRGGRLRIRGGYRWEPLSVVGYDGNGYGIGSRIEIHPGTDLWMRGARFGVVVGISATAEDRVRVTLDRTGDEVWGGPADRFRAL